jgi:polysaccharide deacetylase family protein (PEP-CTERM system associated)
MKRKRRGARLKNALTIDVEDWYQTSALRIDISQWPLQEDRVERNTYKLLALLDKHRVKATFFVLGCVAQKHPELIRSIAHAGHEVGSHGVWHRMLSELTLEEFREDLRESRRILEELTGKQVTFYRAPSWSMSSDRYEVLNVLSEEGFICDSSIQPFATPFSGINGSPDQPFHPIVGGKTLDLLEVPSSVLRIGKLTLPFSGGFYLRALPYFYVSWVLRQINRSKPGMIYVHPWELDTDFPKLKVSFPVKLAQYYRLKSTERKLDRLLNEFEFAPLGEIIRERLYPDIPLN